MNSVWMKGTYPFAACGDGISIHYSCEILRSHANKISLGHRVLLDREVWLNVPIASTDQEPALIIGDGANIGRRSVISAVRQIRIGRQVLFAPGVFVTDHNHVYEDPTAPIAGQGVSAGGTIVIEENCWLGYGSMVLASRGDVVIGRNSVIGAYAVVTDSCPPCSVMVGNPARVVKHWDAASGRWVRA